MFIQKCLTIYIISTLISTLECDGVFVLNYPLDMEKFKNYYQNGMGCLGIFSILENNIQLNFN
jgi:hypothetical protein